MVRQTNVVALVESDFLVKAREMMSDRDKAFALYEWSIECLRRGEHRELVEQLIGELINERFALKKMLDARTNGT